MHILFGLVCFGNRINFYSTENNNFLLSSANALHKMQIIIVVGYWKNREFFVIWQTINSLESKQQQQQQQKRLHIPV